jgi:hypothetical protein
MRSAYLHAIASALEGVADPSDDVVFNAARAARAPLGMRTVGFIPKKGSGWPPVYHSQGLFR